MRRYDLQTLGLGLHDLRFEETWVSAGQQADKVEAVIGGELHTLDPLCRVALVFPFHVLKPEFGSDLRLLVADRLDEWDRARSWDREYLLPSHAGFGVEWFAGRDEVRNARIVGDILLGLDDPFLSRSGQQPGQHNCGCQPRNDCRACHLSLLCETPKFPLLLVRSASVAAASTVAPVIATA